MIEVFLVSSVLLNIFFVWYTRNTLKNLLYLSENLGSLYEVISSFSEHLKEVYELERFYGDPTLTYLLEHSNAVRGELDKYEEVFLLSEPPKEDYDQQEVEVDGEEKA
tara:strand:- start:2929 stop:3252 length:324 start_codon:yes stop_codon:yes gene_type:complete